MTIIKICGLTGVDSAIQVAGLGPDMVGLVLAESRRKVTYGQATEIASAIRKAAPAVAIAGVFVNEDCAAVNRAAETIGLDIVQISGDEPWDYCLEIERPVIKVVHVTPAMGTREALAEIVTGYHVMKREFLCLLDSRNDSRYGGSGFTMNPDVAEGVSAVYPVIIAGGLSPANVGSLIRKVKPLGVDVSSGVETGGTKDIQKIGEFIRAVRAAPCAEREAILRKSFLKVGENVTG